MLVSELLQGAVQSVSSGQVEHRERLTDRSRTVLWTPSQSNEKGAYSAHASGGAFMPPPEKNQHVGHVEFETWAVSHSSRSINVFRPVLSLRMSNAGRKGGTSHFCMRFILFVCFEEKQSEQ